MSAKERPGTSPPNARPNARGDSAWQRSISSKDRPLAAEEEGLFLCFLVADERYLLEVRHVKEVTRVTHLTPIPRSPEGIAGVVDLRGTFIPVVDVRQRLGLGETSTDPRHARIVVAAVGGRVAGLLVDGLRPVVRFPVAQIQPPPALTLGEGARFIVGLCARAGEAFLLIDPARLLALSVPAQTQESAA